MIAAGARRDSRKRGLAVAAASLIFVAAAAGAPAPLYELYQLRFGISDGGITGAFAIYILAAVCALLLCGRLSDHLGRRPVAIVAVLMSMAGCITLAGVNGLALLIAGRGLQGAAIGLAASALGSYVVDLDSARAPHQRSWAAAVTSGAQTAGLATGALVSGALVQFAPAPRTLIYGVVIAGQSLCLLGLTLSPETRERTPGARRSLRPEVRIPTQVRSIFPLACCCFVAAWALGGLYQALGASIAANILGHSGQLYGGLTVASLIGTSAVGGPLTGRLSSSQATSAGALALIVGVLASLFWLHARSTPGFLVASIVAGVGFGAAFHGSMRSLLARISAEERAGLLAAVYLVAYTGAAVPAFVAGLLVPYWGLETVAQAYGALIVVLAGTALLITAAQSKEGLVKRGECLAD